MKKTKEINIMNHLFICIIINLIPIIMLGVFQVSQSLYSKMVYAIFCIQTIIMIFAINTINSLYRYLETVMLQST